MYSTGTSAIFLGNSSPVFFCGMPIADVGPVADTIKPILICARAAVEKHSAKTTAMRANTGWLLVLRKFRFYRARDSCAHGIDVIRQARDRGGKYRPRCA